MTSTTMEAEDMHPASALVPDFAKWSCNTTEAMQLRLVRQQQGDFAASEPTIYDDIQPEFTYSMFGQHETAFGYKELSIKIYYTSGSLRPYLHIDYSDKYVPASSSKSDGAPEVQADDIEAILKGYLPPDYCKNYDEFSRYVREDSVDFKPNGEKLAEYTRESEEGEEETFEIYKSSFTDHSFRKLHRRMQFFVPLFVEGATYIDDEDEKWEIYTIYKREGTLQAYRYHFVGYCTAYPFFCWPDNTRMRISQFLVLPPFQQQGHGSKLYQTLYQYFTARKDVIELTVEDPNQEFCDMRDKNDFRHLLHQHAFDGVSAPVPEATVKELCKKYKLTERQVHRCIEIYLLSGLNKLNADDYRTYRLQVKERLYNFNREALADMEPEERKAKLHETYLSIEEDYHRLLEVL
ncbi:acyl-CoA N-acyltransferase [Radiomyces spectabilis]|uniref:acyl-CoA N-acyltransferase n=1 Tax=Radiomyces spectabilis TaxID=64574 RepID=UPI00221F70EC|nr:acyl-CoA N-acyltransferase [Radiomyces spectabilis]KAI8380970.1 acyl-CoA N-acyltransferase [Radiomyces spectabilis]